MERSNGEDVPVCRAEVESQEDEEDEEEVEADLSNVTPDSEDDSLVSVMTVRDKVPVEIVSTPV